MSRCDCLECSFRRADREMVHTRDDIRLRAAMTALSRVMYWAYLSGLESQRRFASKNPYSRIEHALESGYFRLVYT